MTKKLEENGYRVFESRRKGFESTIVIDTKRFTIERETVGPNQTPVVVAFDNFSQKRCLLSSVQVRGMSYELEGEDLQDVADTGDKECNELMEFMQKIEIDEKLHARPIDAVIIGSDVNADPEKWAPRFEVFKKAGLQVNRTGQATNTHTMSKSKKERELDFIFTKILGKKRTGHEQSVESCEVVGALDPRTNKSDHRAVKATIRL